MAPRHPVGARALARLVSILALPLVLGGCGFNFGESVGIGALVSGASIVVFGRAVPDLVYSTVSGRDCSVVRLEQGKTYCRPIDPPPVPPRFCTHSLGAVDCWANPEDLPPRTPQVADGPSTLTPEQEAYRTRRWPAL